jgi:hypothetical protein
MIIDRTPNVPSSMPRSASEMPRYKSGLYKTTRPLLQTSLERRERPFKLVEYKEPEDVWKIAPVKIGAVSNKAIPLPFLDARLWGFILEWLV